MLCGKWDKPSGLMACCKGPAARESFCIAWLGGRWGGQICEDGEEVVMESTGQYWKPVWGTLELYWKPARQQREGATKMSGKLHLCQAKSNRGPRGRKNDFADGERMIKRLVAQELVLSFVPDPEQRLWRTVTRRKQQLTRAKVRFKNQLDSLLG